MLRNSLCERRFLFCDRFRGRRIDDMLACSMAQTRNWAAFCLKAILLALQDAYACPLSCILKSPGPVCPCSRAARPSRICAPAPRRNGVQAGEFLLGRPTQSVFFFGEMMLEGAPSSDLLHTCLILVRFQNVQQGPAFNAHCLSEVEGFQFPKCCPIPSSASCL